MIVAQFQIDFVDWVRIFILFIFLLSLRSGEHILNVYNRFFTQIYPQNIAKFNSNQRIRFAI